MSYLSRDRADLLRAALNKLTRKTSITNVGPGSVARAFTEAITDEIGNLYTTLDLNMAETSVTTASGQALDLFGEVYRLPRKKLSDLATLDQSLGNFYFYVDDPAPFNIFIPAGVRVTTSTSFSEDVTMYSYYTNTEAVIEVGRRRGYTSLRPATSDSVFTAGAHTLVKHNFIHASGIFLQCTNDTPIAASVGLESDDAYRSRIINEIRRTGGGSLTAVRFAGLSVEGVRDVSVLNTPYALGTVHAVVLPEDFNYVTSVVSMASLAMESVKPIGIRLFTTAPQMVLLDLDITLILNPNLNMTNGERQGIADRARIGILRYLNRLVIGAEFVYNQMLQSIFDSSGEIYDVVVKSMAIGSVELPRQNYSPKEDELLVPGSVTVSAVGG